MYAKLSLSRETGATLIELLIAAGVTAIVLLVITTAIVNQLQSVSYLEDKLAWGDLSKEASFLLADQAACDHSLKGAAILSGPQNVIIKDNGGGARFAAAGTHSAYEKIRISSIQVKNKTISGASQTGVAEVVIKTIRTRQGGGPQALNDITLPVSAKTDALGRIDACGAPSGSIADLCSCNGYGATSPCSCCAPGKTWNLLASWDQDDRHGFHKSCAGPECPTVANTTDWMMFLCVATN